MPLNEAGGPSEFPRVGRYQVLGAIGEGAMGRVWRGFDPELSRPVAIKTVRAEYLTRDTREEFLHRFRREARAAGLLSHPNIVRIFDVGDDYFVMELVEGATLADLIKHRGPLPLTEAVALLAPLAEAIDEAHRAGVMHRDIKPANVMVQADGRPKLMDFGVARLESSVATADGRFFGSPSYMAPEQVAGGATGNRADLFSFAVVAYETLTGQRPFQGPSITSIMYNVVHSAAPSPRTLVPELPAELDEVFRRALAKRPEHRFPTASAFMAALRGEEFEHLLAPLPEGIATAVQDPSAETVELAADAPPPRRSLRSGLPLVASLAVLVALLGSIFGTTGWPGGERAAASNLAVDTALKIETNPASADVWIDGRRAGSSPVALAAVARGAHRLRVTHEGYAAAELMLQVSDAMGEVPLYFSLVPLTGALEVRTREGVAVSVNGRPLGVTPLPPVRLDPGLHQVRLEAPGFATQVHAREARAGEVLVVEVEMAPLPAGAAAAARPRPTAAPPPSPEAVDMGEVLTPPRRISGESAPYPAAARRLQLEGSVLVEVTVEPDGNVGRVTVLESAGSILDQAVVDAVTTWRFEPARVDGQPVRVRWRYRQTFRPR